MYRQALHLQGCLLCVDWGLGKAGSSPPGMYCDFQDGLEGLGDPGGHIAPRVVMLFSTRNGLAWRS